MKKEVMNAKNLLEGHETIKNRYKEVSKAYTDLETALDDYKKRVNNKEVL